MGLIGSTCTALPRAPLYRLHTSHASPAHRYVPHARFVRPRVLGSARPIARHVIQRDLNPRFGSKMAAYDVASYAYQAQVYGLDSKDKSTPREVFNCILGPGRQLVSIMAIHPPRGTLQPPFETQDSGRDLSARPYWVPQIGQRQRAASGALDRPHV
jgi:hypothetical protein